QLHQQKGMISLSPPTICNSAPRPAGTPAPTAGRGALLQKECVQAKAEIYSAFFSLTISR
ncbi:hypothetical protein NY809_21825, partial [Escherichia coli]|uniref:hypothetical protein n=1 Tax=Escherichia coli TaxID=562 RepID=UPI0022F1210E